MASPAPAELDPGASPAPTELDSPSETELEEAGLPGVILPKDTDTLNDSVPTLGMGDGIPNGPANIMPVSLVVDDSPMDGSIIPILHLQVGVPNDPPSSVPNPVEFIEDSLQDDRMNGSVMPNLTETHEMNLHQALLPPKVVLALSDVLAMPPQPIRVRSPALLPDGAGAFAVAGALRNIIAPFSNTMSDLIEWSLPHANDNHFDHCCRIINDIQVVFYIGITENPNNRWAQHNTEQTVGPEPNMVILIEAERSHSTAALEIQLLAQYLPHMRCANRSAGGERASAGSPHYLYVLRAYSPLLRRSR